MNEVTETEEVQDTPELAKAKAVVDEIYDRAVNRLKKRNNLVTAIAMQITSMSKSEEKAAKESFDVFARVFGEDDFYNLSDALDVIDDEELTAITVLLKVLGEANPKAFS